MRNSIHSVLLRKQRGFTLIELMVTIGVAAILVALAAPNFTQMILNNRSEAVGEELANALQVTRTEAIKRGRRVSLCAANNAGDGCANDWTNGWIVVADSAASDEAGAVVINNAAEDVIRHFEAPDERSSITAVNRAAVNFVRFTGTGQLARIGGPANTTPTVFTSYVEGCQGNKQRSITIGVAGMMDVEKTECPGGY